MCIPVSLQDNYYQPQEGDTCYPCDCFALGSESRTCDPQTGHCPCKAGVIGRQCNRCDNPFAEVTVNGCDGMCVCVYVCVSRCCEERRTLQ